jgi:thioesterase domain-containing protein
MLDPPPPPDGRIAAVGDTALLLAFSRLAHPSAEQQGLIREMVEGLDLEAGLDRLLELARAGEALQDLQRPWLRERFDLFCRAMQTVETYVPRPVSGRVTLFRAANSLAPGTTDLSWGWDRLAPTAAHLIPDADHGSLLRTPALDHLVAHLESALAAVDAEPPQ